MVGHLSLSTPSTDAGGYGVMTSAPHVSRQPHRAPWTRERLSHERAVVLGSVIDTSSTASYNSALQSYLSFCRSHDFPIEPTPDTLSVYMSHHIKPASVDSYLSGICNQLEPFYPNARQNWRYHLVASLCVAARSFAQQQPSGNGLYDHLRLVLSMISTSLATMMIFYFSPFSLSVSMHSCASVNLSGLTRSHCRTIAR